MVILASNQGLGGAKPLSAESHARVSDGWRGVSPTGEGYKTRLLLLYICQELKRGEVWLGHYNHRRTW
jgi:hypothetical protein